MEDKKEKEYIMYKITCNTDESLIYIGSTTNFKCRKSRHKGNCNNKNSDNHHIKVYEIIRNNGGWNNWTISPIEIFFSDNKIKAKIRENELMHDYKSNLNVRSAYVSDKEKEEYYENNKEKIKQNSKIYYEKRDNKEQYFKDIYQKRKNKEYHLQVIYCDCGCEVLKGNFSRHKKSARHEKYLCGLIKKEEKQAIKQV